MTLSVYVQIPRSPPTFLVSLRAPAIAHCSVEYVSYRFGPDYYNFARFIRGSTVYDFITFVFMARSVMACCVSRHQVPIIYRCNHPALQGGSEGSAGKGGMPCTLCPHPKCKHSMIRQGVSSCPECDNGTLVLDPVSAPKWRLDCNRCSFLIYLPAELHNAKLAKERCQVHTCLSPFVLGFW